MRTWSDEFKKHKQWGTSCSNCGCSFFNFKNIKLFNEKDKCLSVGFVWNIPNGSYMQCQKCGYKTPVFKIDADKFKNDNLKISSGSKVLDSRVDIIKIDKLKSYSVADELLKWVKLKEDGHITEQEFDDARKKLLKRD